MDYELRKASDKLQQAIALNHRIQTKTLRWLSSNFRDGYWRREHKAQVEPSVEWNLLRISDILDQIALDHDIDLDKIRRLK